VPCRQMGEMGWKKKKMGDKRGNQHPQTPCKMVGGKKKKGRRGGGGENPKNNKIPPIRYCKSGNNEYPVRRVWKIHMSTAGA